MAAKSAEVKPEDTAWSELVAALELSSTDDHELKRTRTALEKTEKLLADKDEETERLLKEKDEAHAAEIAALRAQLSQPAEGVPTRP